jgi:hypothetical protein
MKLTQRQRVEHLLRARAETGVHTFELRQAFIANPSQRVAELEQRGWDIQHTGEKLHGSAFGTRYVLIAEPENSEAPASNRERPLGSPDGVPIVLTDRGREVIANG